VDFSEIYGRWSLLPTNELITFWAKFYQKQRSRIRQQIRINVKPNSTANERTDYVLGNILPGTREQDMTKLELTSNNVKPNSGSDEALS